MSVRPHEIITTPDTGASRFSKEGLIRRRFDRRLRLLEIPDDLTGWNVLDIGAWHGYFSFECERQGADRVLAIDHYSWNRYGMKELLAAKARLNSRVEHRTIDVYKLKAEEKPCELCAMPPIAGLQQMLRATGYDDTELVYTPSFKYWKKLVALVTNRPQSGHGIVHAHVQSQ